MIRSAESRQQQDYGYQPNLQRPSPYESDPLTEAFARAFEVGNNSFSWKTRLGHAGGSSFGIRTPFSTTSNVQPPMPVLKSIYIQKVEIPLDNLYRGIKSFRFELHDNIWTRYQAAIRGKIIFLSIYQGMMYTFPILRISKVLVVVIGIYVVHVTLPHPDPEASYTVTLRKGAYVE